MVKNYQPLAAGVLGFMGLLLFYFLTMRLLAGSWYAAVSQFEKLWYFMTPLSISFGLQVGLYKKIQDLNKNNSSKNVLITNTTASTVGMIACCAHHFTDVLPILGWSFFSLFLIQFQGPILITGVISNLIGIYYLVAIIKKSGSDTLS